MEIYIELTSTTKFKKGDRVIANFGTKKEPEYYIGTVTSSGKKISVLFDDGDKSSFNPRGTKLQLGVKRKRKTEIPAKQIDKWVAKSEVKEKKGEVKPGITKNKSIIGILKEFGWIKKRTFRIHGIEHIYYNTLWKGSISMSPGKKTWRHVYRKSSGAPFGLFKRGKGSNTLLKYLT